MAGLLCLLAISVLMIPGYGHARLEYPLLIILVFAGLVGGRFGRIRNILPELALFCALMLSASLSIFVYYSTHSGFHWRDLMSVLRLPVYSLVLTGALLVPMDARLKRVFGALIVILCVMGTLVSVVQYFNIGGLNAFFLQMYRSDVATYVDQFIYGSGERRVIGTAGNPNLWGFAMACYGIYVFARITIARGYALLPVLFGVIVAIVMTGSRSSLLSFVIGAVTILIASLRYARSIGPALLLVAVMTVSVPVAVVVIAQQLGSERFDTQNVRSMYGRFYVWRETLKEYQDDLLIGRGPLKSARKNVKLTDLSNPAAFSTRDNNYIAALAETGILGLVLLLTLFGVIWVRLWRLASRVPPSELHWVLSSLGVMTAWIAFNATADAFNNVYLAHNFWVLYGVTLAIAYNSLEGVETASVPSEIDSLDRDRYTDTDEHKTVQPVARS
jgi:O-antigen ligase